MIAMSMMSMMIMMMDLIMTNMMMDMMMVLGAQLRALYQSYHLHHNDVNEDYCGDDIADDDDSNVVVDDYIYDVDNGSPLHHFTSQMGHDSTGSFSIQSSPKMTSR
jgi:hypothetical protein